MVAKTDQKARLFDLAATLLELLRDGKRDPEEVANILQAIKDGRKLEFADAVTRDDVEFKFSQYRQFLKLAFGIKEFNPKRIPAQVPGLDRLLGVPKNTKPSQIIEVMRAKGIKVWTYESLDYLDGVVSDREPAEDYAIRLRDRQEADEELKDLSADRLTEKGVKGITLTERLLYGFKYFMETGHHLDEKNITLCSGSRYPDGCVPCVHWDPLCGGVYVGWYFPGEAYSGLRSRQAIS